MLSHISPLRENQTKLQAVARTLGKAQASLHECSDRHPELKTAALAFGRLARAAQRPIRLAIFGESNSGKTSLANLIVGGLTLPALPVANTRLPTLLQYAEEPSVRAFYSTGQSLELPSQGGVQTTNIIRLDVGLPSETLRWIEVLDFPGGENPLLQTDSSFMLLHGIDFVIWATVATQAWRNSEQMAWLALPERLRSYGLLTVTHCDLVPSDENLRRLRARLEAVAKPYFGGMCFIGGRSGEHRAGLSNMQGLFSQVGELAKQLSADRLEKALLVTRRIAGQTLQRLGPKTGA